MAYTKSEKLRRLAIFKKGRDYYAQWRERPEIDDHKIIRMGWYLRRKSINEVGEYIGPDYHTAKQSLDALP